MRNFALGATTAALARYTWSSVYDVRYPSSYTVCTTGNGTIYTVDRINPTAECISVKDGRLTAIGSRGEFLSACKRCSWLRWSVLQTPLKSPPVLYLCMRRNPDRS